MTEQVILNNPDFMDNDNEDVKKTHRKGSSTLTSSLTLSQCSIQCLDQDILAELTETLRIRRLSLGETHPKVGESFNFIGNFHFRRGNYSLACEFYQFALPCFQLPGRPSHDSTSKLSQIRALTATIVTLTNLGTSLYVIGKLDESIQVLEEALTKYYKLYPTCDIKQQPDQLDIGKVYYNLAIVHYLRCDYDLSMILMDNARSTWESVYGPNHITTARALDGLGKIYLAQGKINDAHHYHEAALRTKQNVMGKRHASTLFSMSNLASVLVQQGDHEKALRLLESVLWVQKERLLEPNGLNVSNLIDVGNTLQKMASILVCVRRGDDSTWAYSQALSHYKSAGLDESDVRVAKILERIK